MNKVDGYWADLMYDITQMQMDNISTSDLKTVLGQTSNPEIVNKVKLELQLRQLNQTIKWQRWVAIGTGALAVATFILAVITWLTRAIP